MAKIKKKKEKKSILENLAWKYKLMLTIYFFNIIILFFFSKSFLQYYV